jgi:hypothetical protein
MSTVSKKVITQSTPANAPEKTVDMEDTVISLEKTAEKGDAVKAVQAGKPILDLGAMAKPQDYADLSSEHIARLRVGRPPNASFFRVHPTLYQDLTVYVHEEGMEKVTYLITSPVYAQVIDEPAFKHKRYYLYMTQNGVLGLLPVSLPNMTGRLDSWSESMGRIVSVARERYVRVISNMELREYTYREAVQDFGEPSWPNEEWVELLSLAFQDRIIDSMDHDIIRKLNGEIS